MKECCRCHEVKPLSEFYKKSSTKDGLYRHCKLCQNAHAKKHYQNNPQYYKDKARKWRNVNRTRWGRHGLTEEQLAEMLAKFDGLCWICKTSPATDIDHDHSCCPGGFSCGKCVRGVLCNGCNVGMGFLKDDVVVLAAAIEYLKPVSPDVDG